MRTVTGKARKSPSRRRDDRKLADRSPGKDPVSPVLSNQHLKNISKLFKM